MSDIERRPYVLRRQASSRTLTVRGVDYHLRTWGSEAAPPLVLLHGARDSSASFQFVVDHFKAEWRVIAPDWRGHGRSGWSRGAYWLSDFVCDLDELLSLIFPGETLPIVAHSMGGNIASLYAALRPELVSRLVVLDSLGNTLERSPIAIVEILLEALDERTKRQSQQSYDGITAMAMRLARANRRLPADRAAYLAEANSCALPEGGRVWAYDPTFMRPLPSVHSAEEWGDCWRRIAAPVLCLIASDPRANAATTNPGVVRARAGYFPDITVRTVPETGHNLHHDAPEYIADAVETFLAARTTQPTT
jgi:pimeloyl-ACP methyl ester carboxylesterase